MVQYQIGYRPAVKRHGKDIIRTKLFVKSRFRTSPEILSLSTQWAGSRLILGLSCLCEFVQFPATAITLNLLVPAGSIKLGKPSAERLQLFLYQSSNCRLDFFKFRHSVLMCSEDTRHWFR